MKKLLTVLLIILFAFSTSLMLIACDKEDDPGASSNVDITIANNSLAYTKANDIWKYPKNYDGQTICITGRYSVAKINGAGNDKHNFVGIYDGCCSWACISFDWAGKFPKEGQTVTVIGTIHKAVSNGVVYAEIEAESVTF